MADTFGDRLREVRAVQGVSQDVLANRTGIHHTAIGRFERGDRDPSLKSLLRLARGLGVEPGVLLNGLEADRQPKTTVEARNRPYKAEVSTP